MQKTFAKGVIFELITLAYDLTIVVAAFILLNTAGASIAENDIFISNSKEQNEIHDTVDYYIDKVNISESNKDTTHLNKKIVKAREDLGKPNIRVASVSIHREEKINNVEVLAATAPPLPSQIAEDIEEIESLPADTEVQQMIVRYANEYGVDAGRMLSIASCESGYNPSAVNGPYAGIYQFSSSTWQSNRKAMGLNPDPGLRFNPEEAAKTAAFKMSRDGFGAWPVCSRINTI